MTRPLPVQRAAVILALRLTLNDLLAKSSAALAELDSYLASDGCDHEAGICQCVPQRAADDLRNSITRATLRLLS